MVERGEINFIDCTTKIINDRNDLLESVFYAILITSPVNLKITILLIY